MITMIYAAEPMTVDIRASEEVSLAQVDKGKWAPRTLGKEETSVRLDRGVFMVLSKSSVGVTVGQAHIVSLTKDGPPGDPPKPFATMINADKLQELIAKGDDAPQ